MVRLLALLDRGKLNPYANRVRRLLSLFSPGFKETESGVDKQIEGYTRLYASPGMESMYLRNIICGDMRVGDIRFRVC